MTQFEYIVSDKTGRYLRGRATAKDPRDLAAILQQRGLFLVKAVAMKTTWVDSLKSSIQTIKNTVTIPSQATTSRASTATAPPPRAAPPAAPSRVASPASMPSPAPFPARHSTIFTVYPTLVPLKKHLSPRVIGTIEQFDVEEFLKMLHRLPRKKLAFWVLLAGIVPGLIFGKILSSSSVPSESTRKKVFALTVGTTRRTVEHELRPVAHAPRFPAAYYWVNSDVMAEIIYDNSGGLGSKENHVVRSPSLLSARYFYANKNHS